MTRFGKSIWGIEMDISFKTESGRFNLRVAAVIHQQERLLVIREENAPYAYLPGGRVHMGEDAEAAILREIKEEIGEQAKIVRPLWLSQNFFREEVSEEDFHELCLYFLVDVPNIRKSDFTVVEKGRENHFFWLDFDQLQEERVYPQFIKKEIKQLPRKLTLRIARD